MKNMLDGYGWQLKLLTLRRFARFQGSSAYLVQHIFMKNMLDGYGRQLKSLKPISLETTLASRQCQTISIFPCHICKSLQLS